MDRNAIILDTSAYSLYLRGREEMRPVIQRADRILVNPIVLGELLAGFRLGKDSGRNRDLLDKFLASPRVGRLDIDAGTSERYAAIVAYLRTTGIPLPTNDIWIAASAMQHGLKVVTADAHFLKIPQILTEHITA